MVFLPLTLLLLSFGSRDGAYAVQGNQTCSTADQRLQLGTYQFTSDCDAMWFCNSSSICDWKGCRRDQYPFGYWPNVTVPLRCPKGQFCPDEEDACQDVIPVGGACQLNRDDECEGPPDFKDLADHSGFGLNVNGSVCLNNVCMWANMTAGSPCVFENTGYTVYTTETEFIDIVSRDNCKLGLYCDGTSKQCMAQKDLSAACTADKECATFNCNASGVCDKPADTPNHVGSWVYIVVAVAIFGGMLVTLIGMFFLHRKQREADREKRLQYWREQNAFRQNILQMQETARNSLMSLPIGANGTNPNSQRNSLYSSNGGMGSDESQMPLTGGNKGSGLRHYVSDDGFHDDDGGVVMHSRPDPGRF
ncbi:hypothetical protein EIP91_007371 [Steccherinum ochraceum]|uniref:Transmembrane protein n=1 Tax=Steccherinum ochraceum TaxID=92696 RepID=A0A4R0S407_9APHY|nr:hypothetical protein EIP91_007371 [Steccherinum ochraceum]